jgi:hypothetical protein
LIGPYTFVELGLLGKHAIETLGAVFFATTLCSTLWNLSFEIIWTCAHGQYFGKKKLNINLMFLAFFVSINFRGAYLEEIADIDDERARNRLHVDPPVFMEDLEPADTVLEEHGEEARVGMLGSADGELGLGARRVVVAQHHLPLVAPHVSEVARAEAQSL